MSLVSDAGSRRSSALAAASVWPLVTSVRSHAAAATVGAGWRRLCVDERQRREECERRQEQPVEDDA